jgi:hypothetical protein
LQRQQAIGIITNANNSNDWELGALLSTTARTTTAASRRGGKLLPLVMETMAGISVMDWT